MRFPRIVLCLLVLALFELPLFGQCGVERWAVKTGTDADAGLVNLNSTTSTTISYLRGLTAPASLPSNNRIQPTETTQFVLNATLVEYKLETDSDYHLVIKDSAGNTMIAEVPSPSCVGAGSPFLSGITNARSQFDATYTATTSFQTANVPVQITGIGFFDFLHGQTGVAPNGIEIHPVLNIVFNPGTTPDFSMAASPTAVSVAQGGSGTSTITTGVSGGFNSAVSLTAGGLPSGATASFSPSSIAAPGSGASTMTINVGASTASGSYTITVTGSGGGTTHTATVALTVTAGGGGGGSSQLIGNPGFENGSSNPAPWTATSGVIDNSTSEAAHSGSWKAWLCGYGSTHTDSLAQTVTIPSNATAATLSFWLHIDTAETGTSALDTFKVQLRDTSNNVLATLATFSNLNANSGYTQVSYNVLAYAGKTVQVYLLGNENASNQTSFVVDDVALNVTTGGTTDTTAPTVTVSAPANGATVSGTVTVSASASDPDNPTVSGMQVLIDGTQVASNTNANSISYSWNTTGAANGSHAITAKAADAAGNVGTSATTTVTVSNSTTTTQLITNGGFETGTSPWTLGGVKVPIQSTNRVHTGSYSLRLGATTGSGQTEPNGDSWAYQQITIPSTATKATLTFWYSTYTTDTITYDWQEAQIQNSSGTKLLQIFKLAANNSTWTQQTTDLTPYKGQTIRVYFNCHGDGYTDPTTLYVDDVSVTVQ